MVLLSPNWLGHHVGTGGTMQLAGMGTIGNVRHAAIPMNSSASCKTARIDSNTSEFHYS